MSKRPSPWLEIPCPAVSYHDQEVHWVRYHRRLRFWHCDRCGLSGTEAGFLRLVELAIERFDLATGGAFREPARSPARPALRELPGLRVSHSHHSAGGGDR